MGVVIDIYETNDINESVNINETNDINESGDINDTIYLQFTTSSPIPIP
jgi:hypothetical protein